MTKRSESKTNLTDELCPNYEIPCVVCGQKPTIDIVKGRLIEHTGLCGSCCFGEATCNDPDEW